MKVASTFTPAFIEGFVSKCIELGMDAESAERHFKKHAYNTFLASPNVNAGFRERIASAGETMSPAKMARYLTPDILATVVQCRLAAGNDPYSEQIRDAMGLDAPEAPGAAVKAAAAQLSSMYHQFDQLPLNQQMALAALVGGGLGAAKRVFAPSANDQLQQRNVFSRAFRGGLRGAGTGVGVAAGRAAGSSMTHSLDPMRTNPFLGIGGNVGGGLAGGAAANKLMDSVLY